MTPWHHAEGQHQGMVMCPESVSAASASDCTMDSVCVHTSTCRRLSRSTQTPAKGRKQKRGNLAGKADRAQQQSRTGEPVDQPARWPRASSMCRSAKCSARRRRAGSCDGAAPATHAQALLSMCCSSVLCSSTASDGSPKPAGSTASVPARNVSSGPLKIAPSSPSIAVSPDECRRALQSAHRSWDHVHSSSILSHRTAFPAPGTAKMRLRLDAAPRRQLIA